MRIPCQPQPCCVEATYRESATQQTREETRDEARLGARPGGQRWPELSLTRYPSTAAPGQLASEASGRVMAGVDARTSTCQERPRLPPHLLAAHANLSRGEAHGLGERAGELGA